MKIPDNWKTESTHKTSTLNTLALIGISLMWGHMDRSNIIMVDAINRANTDSRIWYQR